MNKEKIVLGNRKELEYDSIGFSGNALEISIVGGNFAEIEEFFSCDQEDLERIVQQDAGGKVQAIHKNYDVFRRISKNKNIVVDELTEETADVITVELEQEAEWKIAVRKLNAGQEIQDGAIEEIGGIVGEMAAAQGISVE